MYDKNKDYDFIKIEPSKRKGKKYDAVFKNRETEKTKRVSFGQENAEDFTIHKDKARRNRYWDRHRKDLKTRNPMRAGYLSLFILWNKPTLSGSVKDYRSRWKEYLSTGNFPTKIESMIFFD